MFKKIHECGTELAKINGRTFSSALKTRNAEHGFGTFPNTEWVDVCPKCHKDFLTISGIDLPFLCGDGVMRTVKDLECQPGNLDFCGFYFTLSALQAGIALVQLEDTTTEIVEKFGEALETNLNPEQAFHFSRQVCEWGRGQRVWANLVRRNGESELGEILNNWFAAISQNDDEVAISLGTRIIGLGVSFASKHLRMISPKRFAVLDEVLSLGLGFALNTKGYLFFLRSLRQFQTELFRCHSVNMSVAAIETGIFMLVRQQVRAR